MRLRSAWLVVLAIVGVLVSAPAFAQITQGRLTGAVTDSQGAVYVSEVSWTAKGSLETPPREVRSLQKFARVA